MIKKILFLLCTLSTSLFAKHVTASKETAPPKNRAWSLELGMIRHIQKIDHHSFQGMGGKISLGYGLVYTNSLHLFDVNLYLGPYGKNFHTMQYDVSGSGLTYTYGKSFSKWPVRGNSMGFGILGGFSYTQLHSKSYARNDSDERANSNPDGIVTAYSNIAAALDLNLGIFLSSIQEQRSNLHDIDHLITRNEGLLYSLQAILPLSSRFRSEYQVLDAKGNSQTHGKRGIVEGMKWVVSIRMFLGT